MKRTITLEDGRKVDCGVKEFEELKEAMKEQNPEKIAQASFKVLLSSDKMMKDLVKKTKELL